MNGATRTQRAGPLKLPRVEASLGEHYEALVAREPRVSVQSLIRQLKTRRAALPGNRGEVEEAERTRWAMELADIIRQAGFPAAARYDEAGQPQHFWKRAFGSRRSKTLRNRVTTYRKLGEWLLATFDLSWPANSEMVLRYLEERHEVMLLGKTVPKSVCSTIALLETVGQVPMEQRICEDVLFTEGIRHWTMTLEEDAPPTKQAQMYSIAILLSCELMICMDDETIGLRFYAFILLLTVWATLRLDDLQHVDPKEMTLSQLGLKFPLNRTKTSGAGKPVGRLQAFVSRATSLTGFDWIRAGCGLLRDAELDFQRDFLCVNFEHGWTTAQREYVGADGVAVNIRSLLKQLRAPVRGNNGMWQASRPGSLVPEELLTFWTGHSGRHTLPSLAAACGVSKSQRDFLGRWAAAQHGSFDDILTSRQVVHGIQSSVCRTLLEGTGPPGYVEGELHTLMQEHVNAAQGQRHVVRARHTVMEWDESHKTWKLGGEYPMLRVRPEVLPAVRGGSPDERAVMEAVVEEETAPYYVTISRSGFRSLRCQAGTMLGDETAQQSYG